MMAHTQGLRFAESANVFDQPMYWQGTLTNFANGVHKARTAHQK